jgi:nitrate/nitrite transporter NarK
VLSDRVGQRATILAGFALTIPVIVLLFAWLSGRSTTAFAVTLIGMLGLYGIAYGPVGAYLPRLFRTEYRYTGAGVAYNLGGVVGGAIAPPVATALTATHGPLAVGILLAALGGVSLLSIYALHVPTGDIKNVTPRAVAQNQTQ